MFLGGEALKSCHLQGDCNMSQRHNILKTGTIYLHSAIVYMHRGFASASAYLPGVPAGSQLNDRVQHASVRYKRRLTLSTTTVATVATS